MRYLRRGEYSATAAATFARKSDDGFGAKVVMKRLGQCDRAVGLQSAFQQGDKEAGERGAGAVDGMAEAVFAVFAFVADVPAAGLEIAEAAAAGDVQIVILAG